MKLNDIEPTRELLEAINPTEEYRVSRAEYILHMLQLEGIIDSNRHMKRWAKRFEEFDLDRDRYLTLNDVNRFEKLSKHGHHLSDNIELRPQRKKSMIIQITEETREVLLETIGKRMKTDDPSSSTVMDVVESPLKQALALRRASSLKVNKGLNIAEREDDLHEDIELSSIVTTQKVNL